MRKKHDLPQKVCQHCGLPFTWRKKWETVWDAVKYCSDRCRTERKRSGDAAAASLPPTASAKPTQGRAA